MITQEKLKELLEYDQETGVFTRKIDCVKTKKGDIAGNDNGQGYKRISIFGKRYRLHRLAWLYVYGIHPVNEIDHINGIRDDNRILNLREVTRSENSQNQRKAKKNNKTGLLGVSSRNGKYRAQLEVKGKYFSSPPFKTKEEAYEEYIKMKRLHHGENCMI